MFLDYLTSDERFAKATGTLRRGSSLYAPSFYAPYVLAGLIRAADAPGWLVVVPEAEQAARLAAELAVYLERDVETLPARGVLYGADVAPAAHILGQRQRALAALEQGGVVVADAVGLATVTSGAKGAAQATVRLELPAGWSAGWSNWCFRAWKVISPQSSATW